MGQGYELFVTVSADIFNLPIFSTNNTTDWGLSIQIPEPMGDHSDSNHHTVLGILGAGVFSKPTLGSHELCACLHQSCTAESGLCGQWNIGVETHAFLMVHPRIEFVANKGLMSTRPAFILITCLLFLFLAHLTCLSVR